MAISSTPSLLEIEAEFDGSGLVDCANKAGLSLPVSMLDFVGLSSSVTVFENGTSSFAYYGYVASRIRQYSQWGWLTQCENTDNTTQLTTALYEVCSKVIGYSSYHSRANINASHGVDNRLYIRADTDSYTNYEFRTKAYAKFTVPNLASYNNINVEASFGGGGGRYPVYVNGTKVGDINDGGSLTAALVTGNSSDEILIGYENWTSYDNYLYINKIWLE